jgi:5'-nucleotidase
MPVMHSRRWLLTILITLLALVAVACSDDDNDDGGQASSTTTTAPSNEPAPLNILVTNDDGYSADGIDAVVEALRKEPKVHVDVVAPATNQSGQGENTTPGELAVEDVQTKSGYPAKSVAGHPADAVNVALDKLHLTPDLVVSGTNAGQNIGEFAKVSGTVGAAKTAAKHGIPALAVSTGLAPNPDYAGSAELAVEWLREHRAAIAADRGEPTVESLNVPTCKTGERRGLLRTTVAVSFNDRPAAGDADCLSTKPKSELADDVDGFLNGFATLTPIPVP